MENTALHHFHLNVNGSKVHAATAGNSTGRPVLFLHGYPQNWRAFEKVMEYLEDEYFVVAIDLPGIGGSAAIAGTDKKSIAAHIHRFALQMQLKAPVVVGHDIGGMVTFSLLKHFAQNISKAVIMNTAIPGLEPWEAVKRNPHIWHFALYAVPGLPEKLIDGREQELFNYFYDTLSANKERITAANRGEYVEAYRHPAALKTALGWYRAFPQDEKDNAGHTAIHVPVLYLRGDKDPGKTEDYLAGLEKGGVADLQGRVVPNSGHFSAEEAPRQVAAFISEFCAR